MGDAKRMAPVVAGRLIGFTRRWNPLSTEIFAKVEVGSTVISVPIDYRQQKFIQKEHPINSPVSLVYKDGRWQIASRMVAVEQNIMGDNTVFL